MRRTTGLLAVLALLSGCAVPIAQDLGDDEATRLVASLERAGIGVVREPTAAGRARLLVAPDDAARAFDAARARRDAPTAALIPTEREVHAAFERARAASVERAVAALPGVSRATVTLTLPLRDPLSGDAPAAARAVAVVEGATSDVAVRRVVAAAIDGLEPARVAVHLSPPRAPTATPRLARVGPFIVAARSAPPLRATLAAFLGSMAIAASSLAWSRLRRRA